MCKYLVHIANQKTPTGFNRRVSPKSLEIAMQLPVLIVAETAMVARVPRVPIRIGWRKLWKRLLES